MLQLYSHPNSTYSQRVRIYFVWKEIPFEILPVALEKLENRKKPFIEINPHGKVPVLKDGDWILCESYAIMRYVEEKFPDTKPLIPIGMKERALLTQYACQAETEFTIPASFVYFAKKFIKEEKWDLNRMKESTKRVGRHLDSLDSFFQSRKYFFEEQFGFMEIMYAPFINNISYMELEVPTNVQLWIDRVLSEPAVKSVLGEKS
ncbi:glutathione S-transferase, N-terminal domain protein [Leptospira ryugenii]|uniref:Glutathione S-transferase, N-terminal domain protein n=1 Tax=Leptospira ryugenii TaxID=1917863 RepID=A0A2P2DXJ6_9LEPT|nr:glutathione S-transferase family protein [Leptospira ryugenii]GBF49349.1 glutathione S-transferase, N-terminal domain protein [Leptospira ryugenii]